MRRFTYQRASRVDEAVRLVGASSSARFLGGGTNLVDLLKMDVQRADALIDVRRLPLATIEATADGLRIGATATNTAVATHALVRDRAPVLADAILAGASPQLRNMATVGGNLLQRTRCYYFMDPAFPCNKRAPGTGCSALDGDNRIHAILGASASCIAVHPSDMCVALAALEATVHVQGPNGARAIPMSDFHRLPEDTPDVDTTLARDELITHVDVPAPAFARRSLYLKVRDRAQYAFALVSVAVVLDVNAGKIRGARLALGGVAHKPWRALTAERGLVGAAPRAAAFTAAAALAMADAQPREHNRFKVELAKRAIVRALTMAAAMPVRERA